jgi:polar amino acid transport system substrate-binding protein
MVRQDKAHAMVADFPICHVSVFRYPDSDLTALKKPLSYEPLGIALPANDFLLLNWLQNSIHTMEKSGQMEALVEKWFSDGSWIKQLQ